MQNVHVLAANSLIPIRSSKTLIIILCVTSALTAWHVFAQVSIMDDELMSMSKKMDDLQTKYNFMQENSAKEIKRLHERLHLFHEHSPKRGEL